MKRLAIIAAIALAPITATAAGLGGQGGVVSEFEARIAISMGAEACK